MVNARMPISELEPVGPGGEVQLVGGQEQAEGEQQRVTGQEREQQPALDEDDDQADPHELGVEVVEQPVGVHPGDPQEHGCAGRSRGEPTERNLTTTCPSGSVRRALPTGVRWASVVAMEQSERDGVLAAAGIAADLVRRPEVAERWGDESACAGMTVGGLAFHLGTQTDLMVRLLAGGPVGPRPDPAGRALRAGCLGAQRTRRRGERRDPRGERRAGAGGSGGAGGPGGGAAGRAAGRARRRRSRRRRCSSRGRAGP